MGKIGDLILFNVFENKKKINNLKINRISILYHNVIYSKKITEYLIFKRYSMNISNIFRFF